MGIVYKPEPPAPQLLGGKPMRVTNYKTGEVPTYNRLTQQWEAQPGVRGVAVFVDKDEPVINIQDGDLWIRLRQSQ